VSYINSKYVGDTDDDNGDFLVEMKLKLKIHEDVILGVSRGGWNSAAATFGTLISFIIEDYCPFYTGVSDAHWSQDDMGITVSKDCFLKRDDVDPIVDLENLGLKEAVTPVIFQIKIISLW